MMTVKRTLPRSLGLVLLAALASGCVTTTTSSRTWGAGGAPARPGQVAWIRETVQHQEGNPAGGAAVGAVVGGLFGNAMTGGRPGGTLMGAIGGAAVGASASQGSAQHRTYEVAVQFDDGAQQVFVYANYCPFQVGERVLWDPRGLMRDPSGRPAPYPPAGTSPPPPATTAPPYAPPSEPPPPPPPPPASY